MTTSFFCIRVSVVCAVAVLFAACTGTPVDRAPSPLEGPLSRTSQTATGGQAKEQLTLGTKAVAGSAMEGSANTIAQGHYDAEEFAAAIVAAREVLKNAPNDASANGIIALSGLRLSTTAIGQLRQQAKLSDPLKAELKGLATALSAILKDGPAKPEPQSARCRREKCNAKLDPFCVLQQSCTSNQGTDHGKK